MSIDYLEQDDADARGEAKEEFFDYILEIERLLDEAERFGSHSDARMFVVLKNAQSLYDEAREHAGERLSWSLSDVAKRISRIEREHVDAVLSASARELALASDLSAEERTARRGELERILKHYREAFPMLDLEKAAEAISATDTVEEAT